MNKYLKSLFIGVMSTIGVFAASLAVAAGAAPAPAPASVPAPTPPQTSVLTCEQRVAILDQLAGDLSTSRRNIEIELAALRVQVQTLANQLQMEKKATENTKEKKKP